MIAATAAAKVSSRDDKTFDSADENVNCSLQAIAIQIRKTIRKMCYNLCKKHCLFLLTIHSS